MQLYLEDKHASITRPLKSLKGFSKIDLLPNQEKSVEFILSKNDLSLYNEELFLVEEPRELEILVGDLKVMFEIK